MEPYGTAEPDYFDDDFPCLAREECVGDRMREVATLFPAGLDDGDDD